MRLSTIAFGLAAALFSPSILADSLPEPTSTPTTSDDYRAQITAPPISHLEIRQNLGVNPEAEQAPGQVPPVTIYTIATQVGQTGVVTQITYTQLFSAVPDQWPSPQSGVIGLGTDKRKRALATVEILDVQQPVVLVLQTEVVHVPVQKVTLLTVVETMVVTEFVRAGNETALRGNGSSTAFEPLASSGFRPGAAAATAARQPFSLGTRVP